MKDALNSKEERIMNLCYTKQDCLDMDWAYETNWALLWALGLIDDDIRNPNILADCEKSMSLLKGSSLKNSKIVAELEAWTKYWICMIYITDISGQQMKFVCSRNSILQ